MAITKNYIMTIDKNKSVLNKDLIISTNDNGIDICFRILDSPYITLSKYKNLLSKIVLKSPLGKEFESDLTSIVSGRVFFTITKELMNEVTETGIYKLYIVVYDDKNNRNILPPIDMIIEEYNIDLTDISNSNISNGVINNTITSHYGNSITLYNSDGSYNRTIWVNNDIITDAKMNKIEEVISDLRDDMNEAKTKIKEIDDENSILILNGKESSPIIIAELDKGFYIIDGFVKDFANQDPYELKNTNYFYITGLNVGYTIIERCLNEEEHFRRYKYNKVLERIDSFDNELKNVKVSDGYASVTDDEYQIMNIDSNCTMLLPDVDNFTNINLFVLITDGVTITFPTIKWANQPTISVNNLSKIVLTYIDGTWYGNNVFYEK